MLRGIDRRNIFLDDEDKIQFIDKMIRAKKTAGFQLYGYCLMDNHVHLLISESEEIGTSIKRITIGYVQCHNTKYGRSGHLFQNRFLSEPVEKESYLLNVLRYIHQNPVKAGMVKRAAAYPWSSYSQYISAYRNQSTYIDEQLIMAYLSKKEAFEKYMNLSSNDEYLDLKPVQKYTDENLKSILHTRINANELTNMPIEKRNKLIKELYQQTGANIRQLARVLGLGKNIIERAVKQDKRNVPLS